MACGTLASCVPPIRTIVENASGQTIVVRPLGTHPTPVEAGTRSRSVAFAPYTNQEALIGAGGCLFTYRPPDPVPRKLRSFSPRVFVRVDPDMVLHVHDLTADGERGEELVGPGLPLTPMRFCGAAG